MRNQNRLDLFVILYQIALRVAVLRPENFVEIREFDPGTWQSWGNCWPRITRTVLRYRILQPALLRIDIIAKSLEYRRTQLAVRCPFVESDLAYQLRMNPRRL